MRFAQAATGLQEHVALVADLDVAPEIIVLAQIIDDLVGEVVDIHHDIGDAGRLEALDLPLQKGFACEWHKCFG